MSLLRLIFQKRRDALPDGLAEELDATVADGDSGALLTKLAELGLGWSRTGDALAAFDARSELDPALRLHVEEQAVLGLFPQSSSDLLQDYDALLQAIDDPAVDLGELLAGARLLVPGIVSSPTAPRPMVGPAEPLLFADPTQREVIDASRQHIGMVVDGPPGTGKSQVIVNLVLDAVRRGERVAVVCEKRAALDVVQQRIEGLGVAHALALVHDVNQDRKPLFDRIGQRIEAFRPEGFDAAAADALAADHGQTTRILDERVEGLGHLGAGTKLTVGQLHALTAGHAGGALEPSPLVAIPQERFDPLLALLPRLAGSRGLWGPGSPYRAPQGVPSRKSFATFDEASLRAVGSSLARAQAAATAYEGALAGATIEPNALARIAPLLGADREMRALRRDAESEAFYTGLVRGPAGGDALEAAHAEVMRAQPALVEWWTPVTMLDSAEVVSAIAIARAWAGRFLRVFVLGWWSARGVVQRVVRGSWPEQAGRPLDATFLEQLSSRLGAARAWASAQTAFAQLGVANHLPRVASALFLRLDQALRIRRHIAVLRRASSDAAAIQLPAPGAVTSEVWDRIVDRRLETARLLTELQQALLSVTPLFPWVVLGTPAAAIGALRQAFERDAAALVQADVVVEQAEKLAPGIHRSLDTLARSPVSNAEQWRQALVHGWAAAKLGDVARSAPATSRLGLPDDDALVRDAASRLESLEGSRATTEVARVRAALDRAPFLNVPPAEKHKRRTPEQAAQEELLKEVRKKRNVMALRTFVRKFADRGLLDVLPVWLLSPETMTILFPRAPLFDLVVFDEASQCTVESGFPVLLRAKRVVVAGDEKQMPPTSFFKAGGDADPGDASAPDPTTEFGQDVVAAESLLTLARTRLAHAGLKWHYRCRDEALIAFSNHAMYESELRSIPSTRSRAAESALRWISVPDGAYDDGVNAPEAKRVAALVHELLTESTKPSIGIVTFNLKQRRAILDALEQRAVEDADFSRCWGEALANERVDERPFVKNLESVQGDERDVIVFSLGHAPATRARKDGRVDRYVPARFGPLGQRGGERRLNVAISRAKQAAYIVASFEPELLSAATAKNAGPKLFRDYLEYAHAMGHGQRARADSVLARVREGRRRAGEARVLPFPGYVPVATQIALELESMGIPHELDIGASGFRVPIAIIDPKDARLYSLAILIDEGDEKATAFERFVHRPQALRTRGWRVLQVTAATWSRDRARVLAMIRAGVSG